MYLHKYMYTYNLYLSIFNIYKHVLDQDISILLRLKEFETSVILKCTFPNCVMAYIISYIRLEMALWPTSILIY